MEHPFGVDISSHQGTNINYDLMKQNTKFVAVRAGISWGYEDPVFAQSWRALKGHNRIAYHVLYPSQDVTRQVSWLFDILSRAGFDAETDRLAIDIELWQGQTPQQVTTATERMHDQITERTGREPIVYSGAWFTNSRMVISEKLKQVDWWLATYPAKGSAPGTEHPGPPLLPRGVTKWLIHQTSETGIGRNFGLPSGAIDTNRWNGTLEDVQAYFANTEQEPEPPVDPPTDPVQPLYKARVTAQLGLHVRACASTECKSLRLNPLGTVVDVYEVKNGWSKIHATKSEWSMSAWLEQISPPADPPANDVMYYGALYWQRDPRWKDKPLGTRGTIGRLGCAMVCTANAMNGLGKSINPLALDKWLTENNGYANGNLIIWQALQNLYPDVKWDGMVYQPSDERIKQTIRNGRMPIIVVDYDEGTPAEDMHWVTGIGIDARGRIVIHDPWDNAIIAFRDRYKKPVIRFTGYSRK